MSVFQCKSSYRIVSYISLINKQILNLILFPLAKCTERV